MRKLRRSPPALTLLAACALGAAAALPAAPAAAALPGDACRDIAAAAAAFGGTAGVVLLDVDSGERCGSGAELEFRSASLYKLFVLAEAHEQRALGTFSFDDAITLDPRHAIDDPPQFRITGAAQLPAHEALRRMIVVSDNTSALALREHLGAARVAAQPERLGLEGTSLGAEFTTTAADIARFFALLQAGEVVSTAASAEMLALLRQQEVVDMLPPALPAGTDIAHKTGTLDSYAHDAGLISAPGGQFALAVLTQANQNVGLAASFELIREIASTAYAAYAEPRGALGTGPPVAPILATAAAPAVDVAAPLLATPVASVPAASVPAVAVPAEGGPGWLPSLPANWLPDSQPPPALYATALGVLALASMLVTARRRGRRPAPPVLGAIEAGDVALPRALVADDYGSLSAPSQPTRKEPDMRLRSPKQQSTELVAPPEPVAAPPASVDDLEAHGLDSPRLRRMAQYFAAQGELLQQMRVQVEQETAPLIDLLLRQRETLRQLLDNLDERLEPLERYAEHEEANLGELQERLNAGGTDYVTRSFAEYLALQRERIEETRLRIEEQRSPFERFNAEQREVVEVALSRFDEDLASLEKILAEQRRVMMRLLDAMRSETFLGVKDFLAERHETLADLAGRRVSDPAAIGDALRAKRSLLAATPPANTPGADHVQLVLLTTDESDRGFAEAAPGGGSRPRLAAGSADASETRPASAEESHEDVEEAVAAQLAERA